MSRLNIIRAWKDEEYRRSLGETERAALPQHPAGLAELGDAELGAVEGGMPPTDWCTWSWCLFSINCDDL
jgi:mersacidin/lichenicidin family type 2 lantibiotic